MSNRKYKKIIKSTRNIEDAKIYQKMKNKSLLSIEKVLQHEKIRLTITIKNYFFKKLITQKAFLMANVKMF